MSEALEVRLRHRVHGGLILDVDFTLGRECGILFGPSGAGKTTLLRLIAGLIRPDAGVRLRPSPGVPANFVRLDDSVLLHNRINLPLRKRRIGLVFQDDLLFPHLGVAGNIRFGLKGWKNAEAASRLGEVAELCGVSHLLGRRPETLSGGERQRVGLARALAPRPGLLLCDEPVSALDHEGRHALIARLAAVQRAEGIPVLHVTHSPTEAIALGSRLFLLEGGSIVARGTPMDVLCEARSVDWSGMRNIFAATVVDHPAGTETRVRLLDGPELVVPRVDRPAGSALTVGIRGDDIILSRELVSGLSARNVLPATVSRILVHGDEAEVVAAAGGTTWFVGVVASAVAALGLEPGCAVHMIVKARSCRVAG